jgi:4-amino-4-deoxy-L-arabinose transferase-like glycosyltransferase
MPEDNTRKELWLLLLLALISFYLPLAIAPLFDLDEGAFSEATREMLTGKDYITTYLNGDLRFDKPILIYWFQLLSVKLFGLNEFALRLPSAIAGTLWTGVTYLFVKRFTGREVAFFTALFMLSALQINLIAKAAIADGLLNLFIALTMFAIYLYYDTQKRGYLYATFLFMALGFLTKGPVAILIPFVVSLLFFTLRGRFKLWLKTVFNPPGLLLFAIVALPWYILEYHAQGMAFIDGFFLKHNLHRFDTSMERHSGGWYYYLIVMVIGLLPFTYPVLKSFRSLKKLIHNDLTLYLLLWFGFVFIFFSLSGTKLPHYVIYGYTPLFIFGAMAMHEGISKAWLIWPVVLFLTILLFFPEIALYAKPHIKDHLAQVLIDHVYDGFGKNYRTILIISIVAMLATFSSEFGKKATLIMVAFAFSLAINYALLPSYGKLMQLPVKKAALLAKEKHYKVHIYKVNMPSFNVYYEGLVSKKQPKAGDVVFTKVTSLKDFKDYDTLYRKNAFALIRIKP